MKIDELTADLKTAKAFVKQLYMSQIDNVTRVVLVGEIGRIYDQYVEKVELSYQDDGKTLKIFVTKKQSDPRS